MNYHRLSALQTENYSYQMWKNQSVPFLSTSIHICGSVEKPGNCDFGENLKTIENKHFLV